MAINYNNSKVYKIWSPQGDKIYIGSTTKKLLCQRMTGHREDYKRFKAGKYHFITSFILFEEYGLTNCFIELLEAKECVSKDELHKIEGKYIRDLECINKTIPKRTKEEYYIDNKEHIFKNRQQFREDHKESIKAKKLALCSCDCGSTYTFCHKARHDRSINQASNIYK